MTDQPPTPPTSEPRRARDAAAVLLMAAGGVGLLVTAWTVHFALGAAATCLLLIAFGCVIGLERDR